MVGKGLSANRSLQYVSRPDIFADLFNYLLYDDNEVVRPENLTEMDITAIALPYGMDGTLQAVQKYRDSLKNAVIMEDEDAASNLQLTRNEKGEVNMCQAIDGIREDSILQDRAEGIFLALSGLVCDGLLSISDAAVRVQLSEEEFAEKMKLYVH